MTESESEPDPPAFKSAEAPRTIEIPPQTPFFRASHLARYRRQELIKAIQAETERKLICYVADPAAAITRDDVLPLMDLLHTIEPRSHVDLLLHTSGGDIDAAVKIVGILRQRLDGVGQLRVIIPDRAKSAGTLIAIGGDVIVMSDPSELGPVDPQIITRDGNGRLVQRPALSFVDGFDALVEAVVSAEPGRSTEAELALLAKFDPAVLDICRKALRRSRVLTETLLRRGMLKDGSWTSVALQLTDNSRWIEHGTVIDVDDAESIGLVVERWDVRGELWQACWRLYCEQRLALSAEHPKLLESDLASLPLAE
jgi:hypothetical protein